MEGRDPEHRSTRAAGMITFGPETKSAEEGDLFDPGPARTAGRTVFVGSVVTVAGQAGGMVLTTVALIMLSRMLVPEDFGRVAMITPLFIFLGFFRDFGLATATVQRQQITHNQVSALFWINVSLSLGLALAAFGASYLLAWFFREPGLIALGAAFALNCAVTGLGIQHTALLRRKMATGKLALIGLGATGAGVLAGTAAAWSGMGHWALVLMAMVNTVVHSISVWFACSWRPSLIARRCGLRSLLGFGGFLTGGNAAHFFASSLDSFVIGRCFGAASLGSYSRATQLVLTPLQQLLSPVGTVVVAALSRLQSDPERFRLLALRFLQGLLMGSVPLACGLIIGGDALTRLLLGGSWSEAASLVPVLSSASLVLPISALVSWILIAQGRGEDLMRWNIASVILTGGAILIGLPWGLAGVAAAMTAKHFVAFVLFTRFAGAHGPVKTGQVFVTLWPACGAVITGCATGFLVRRGIAAGNPVHELAAGMGAGGVSFAMLFLARSHRALAAEAWRVGLSFVKNPGRRRAALGLPQEAAQLTS
jgi:polysaccharide transporter, PST family